MKQFKDIITLAKNNRGCYILDTVKGCSGVSKDRPRGCYGDCYANNIASRYGVEFTKPVQRGFIYNNLQYNLFEFADSAHESAIIKAIKKVDMPFVRIGEMGDPSEDWEHTINVCKTISIAGKSIVIITKHWKSIPYWLLPELKNIDLCINTSISAMDSDSEIINRLIQYEKLKDVCKSVLRVVSCDFNKETPEGRRMAEIQNRLFKKEKVLNTVFRPSANNPIVTSGIINIKKTMFFRTKVLASMAYEDTYMGMCNTCPDMCGLNL